MAGEREILYTLTSERFIHKLVQCVQGHGVSGEARQGKARQGNASWPLFNASRGGNNVSVYRFVQSPTEFQLPQWGKQPWEWEERGKASCGEMGAFYY